MRAETMLPPPPSDDDEAPDTVPSSYWARLGDTDRCPSPPVSERCLECGSPLSRRTLLTA